MRHNQARQKYLRVGEDCGSGENDGGDRTPPSMRPMNSIAKTEDGGDEEGGVVWEIEREVKKFTQQSNLPEPPGKAWSRGHLPYQGQW